jgi:N-acetyl-anhydromuramyl-L-alanine amidase AmpD
MPNVPHATSAVDALSSLSAVPPRIRDTPTPHRWMGRPYGPPVAFVLHTESGGDSGTVAEFLNSAAQFSTHYVARLDGSLDCLVDLRDRAWCNGILEPGHAWSCLAQACRVDPSLNPNHVTISCETEDGGDLDRPVSDAQFAAVVYAAREAKRRFRTSLRFLATHADISPQSRSHCPGDRWLASGRFRRLAEAVGLQTLAE